MMPAVAPTTLALVLQRMTRAHGLGGGAANVVDAVRSAACVYGAAPTCYLSVQTRTHQRAPEALDDAILQTRELVRVRAMRGAVYLMPRDLVPYGLALNAPVPLHTVAAGAGIEERAYAPLTDRIEQLLAERPRTVVELREALGPGAPDGVGLSAIVDRMAADGRAVRARMRGSAWSQSYEYARMADWMTLPDERPSLAAAVQALAPLYLRANGPATAADFGWWIGIGVRDAGKALTAIGARPTRMKGVQGDMLATEEVLDDLAGRRESGDDPKDAGDVHLLPFHDAYVMAHRDRSRYLDTVYREHVVDRAGNLTNVILRGGRVVGIWDLEGNTLLYALFASVLRRALDAAATRLAPLYDIHVLREVRNPPPLSAGGPHAFASPLTSGAPRRKRG
jgi:hypothetical protein